MTLVYSSEFYDKYTHGEYTMFDFKTFVKIFLNEESIGNFGYHDWNAILRKQSELGK